MKLLRRSIHGWSIARSPPTGAPDRLPRFPVLIRSRRLVVEVLSRSDLITDPQFATRKARSENKELLRAAIAEVFASDTLENWMAKLKLANIPVGYLRTVEEGFNAPEARERHRLNRIPHRTAEWVPNIEPPINM